MASHMVPVLVISTPSGDGDYPLTAHQFADEEGGGRRGERKRGPSFSAFCTPPITQ